MEEPTYKIAIQSWGPAGWVYLKSVALTFPKNPTAEEQQQYYGFFMAAGHTLPCIRCRMHYLETWNRVPIDMSSRRSVAEWIHNLENEVNERNGKPTVLFTHFIAQYIPPGMYEELNLTKQEQDEAKAAPQGSRSSPENDHIAHVGSETEATSTSTCTDTDNTSDVIQAIVVVILVLCVVFLMMAMIRTLSRKNQGVSRPFSNTNK